MSANACSHCGFVVTDEPGGAGRRTHCPRCGVPTHATPTPLSAAVAAGQPTPTWHGPVADEAPAAEPVAPAPAVTPTYAPAGGQTQQEFDFLEPAQAPDELGRIGPYRVLRIVGTGGMGVVFQAEDPSLRRMVAIKAMLPAVVARGFNRQRFLREAQATARLEHEHIVTIYVVNEQHGIPYLVMQYLQGESLDLCLARERRLPYAEALRITRETAEALAAAHAQNLVHRDVKPANIWLEGSRRRVKLLDFGLARLTADSDTHLTRAGVILGTPAYMSPEQARGKVVDHLGDLFSLGCVLYEMCTGNLPFKGTDVMSRLVSLVMDDPPPLWETAPDIPPALNDLVLQLLAKNPAERFPSASAVVEAIKHLEGRLTGTASAAAPTADLSCSLDDLFGPVSQAPSLPGAPAPEPAPTLPPAAPARLERLVPTVDLNQPVARLEQIAGHMLGRFDIGTVIARGYHGITFRAHDLKQNQTVALKVYNTEFPRDSEELERFSRSTKPLLTLRHPNLTAVTAVGKTGPYCWIAAELIDGENLAQALKRNKSESSNWRLAFRLAVHLARALQFIGENHLRHGNITPANLLVPSGDKNFKLADVMQHAALKGSALRRSVRGDKHLNEAQYLAPELFDSSKGNRDEISDLYSAGVVVYQLLTGRLPYEADEPEEILEQILSSDPPRPRKLRRNIPSRFEWVVLQMLNRERKYRFHNATDLLVYLDRIAEDQGVEV